MTQQRRITLRLYAQMQGLLTGLLLTVTCSLGEVKTAPLPALMPMPAHLSTADGKLIIDASFSAHISGYSDRRLEDAVARLVARVSRQTGIPITGGDRQQDRPHPRACPPTRTPSAHTAPTPARRRGVTGQACGVRKVDPTAKPADCRPNRLYVPHTSRSWTRSRSNGPWTLGGRRPAGPRSRTATRIPGIIEGVRGGRWTLGGRRDLKPSRPEPREGPD